MVDCLTCLQIWVEYFGSDYNLDKIVSTEEDRPRFLAASNITAEKRRKATRNVIMHLCCKLRACLLLQTAIDNNVYDPTFQWSATLQIA